LLVYAIKDLHNLSALLGDHADDVNPGHARDCVKEAHDNARGGESRSPAGDFPD